MKINPTGLDSLSSSRSAVWLSWICTKGRVLIIIVYKIWNLLTCRKITVNQRWRCGQPRVDFRDPGVNQTLGDNDWSIVCDLIISQKINLRSWFWCIQSLNPIISMITNHNWKKKSRLHYCFFVVCKTFGGFYFSLCGERPWRRALKEQGTIVWYWRDVHLVTWTPDI